MEDRMSATYNSNDVKTPDDMSTPTYLFGDKIGLGKGQDIIYYGREIDHNWAILFDCHGTDNFKQFLEYQDWSKIMQTPHPEQTIINISSRFYCSYRTTSGSTFSMMRSFSNRIETFNIGDSRTVIYKDGELVYTNTPHTIDNPSEIERLSGRGVTRDTRGNYIPHMISFTEMRGKKCDYTIFENGCRLIPTQTLGNNNITGLCGETHMEYFDPKKNHMRCVIGSDGFFDMHLFNGENVSDINTDHHNITNMTVAQLLRKAENRWNANWKYYYDPVDPTLAVNTYFSRDANDNQRDDISIVVWDNRQPV